MTLLSPPALLLTAVAVPIVLMFVLKLRRQESIVPSTLLWRKALDDMQADAPWQRLRFNILLLLLLLSIAALVMSLARPAYSQSRTLSGDLIVIVDESYAMQAHDGSQSRFDVALKRAHALVTDLGDGKVMSVIGMGTQPHLAIADSSDHGAIGTAIDSLHVGIEQPNYLGTFSLAASMARAGQDTRVVVLTTAESGINRLPFHVPFPVDIVRVGKGLHDLGITAFSAAPGQSSVNAVARVTNFGTTPAQSDLELRVDGRLADVRPISVKGHGQENLVWTNLPPSARELRVSLTRGDDVAVDKTAWATVAVEPPRHVLLVNRGDYFLQTALRLQDSVRLSVVPPSAYQAGMERSYDAVIFDGFLPRSFPSTPALIVAPTAGTVGGFHFTGNVPAGTVTTASAGANGSLETLLKYVDLSDVHVAQARDVVLPGWMSSLATSNGATLLAAGESSTSRVALVNFDLQHSDWPLRVSFPTTLQNFLRYLAPGLTLGATNITTGQSLRFFPSPTTRRLVISRPDGTVQQIQPPFPPFADTVIPGLYTVKAAGARAGTVSAAPQSFAVNFFPARPVPAGGPAVLHLGQAHSAGKTVLSIPLHVDWAFVLLAALLLSLEWWVAFHGVPW